MKTGRIKQKFKKQFTNCQKHGIIILQGKTKLKLEDDLKMAIKKVTPTELSKILVPLYAAGVPVPTVMQWGPPGVGKSEGVKTMAKDLEEKTGKKVNIQDVRLLLFNPVDLRGIPVPHTRESVVNKNDMSHINTGSLAVEIEEFAEGTPEFEKELVKVKERFAIWLRPVIFNLDPSPNVINILFLDEITAAPPTVQASAYQLTLDRKVGEHTLPDNTIIIAAGNRLADKGVAYKMPTPLANRMTHFEIYADLEDWKTWAIPHGIHELVLGFLNFKEVLLHKFDPSSDDPAFPTPRSWDFVSRYLKIYPNVDSAYPMIAGTVGEGVAVEFKAFAKTYGSLPDVNKILNGEKVQIPKNSMDILCALSSALVSRAPKATKDQLKNILNFTIDEDNGLPTEFSVLTMKDLLRVQNVKENLISLPEWLTWANKNKEYIH